MWVGRYLCEKVHEICALIHNSKAMSLLVQLF